MLQLCRTIPTNSLLIFSLHIYIYIYINIYININTYKCIYTYVYAYIHMHVYECIYIAQIYVDILTQQHDTNESFPHLYPICMCSYIYKYIHIHNYIQIVTVILYSDCLNNVIHKRRNEFVYIHTYTYANISTHQCMYL
jgi:L-asparagine transporter-like permease